MVHEKIIKRKDGVQFKISVSTYMDSYGKDPIKYDIFVTYKEKGKRKWLSVPLGLHDYQFRKLSMEKRAEHREVNNLLYVTKSEIYEAKVECWDLLKPTV